MIRMIESVTIPTAAIMVASAMNTRKLPERTALSNVRAFITQVGVETECAAA
jgi:hypothetical protein